MAATPVLHYWICLHRDQLSMSHHSHGRLPAGRPACAGDLSAVNQPYHPHPTLLCSLQPVGRSNYFMRLMAPQNSHSHTDRQTNFSPNFAETGAELPGLLVSSLRDEQFDDVVVSPVRRQVERGARVLVLVIQTFPFALTQQGVADTEVERPQICIKPG